MVSANIYFFYPWKFYAILVYHHSFLKLHQKYDDELFYLITVFAKIIERLRFTFTPNGKREFVPRDQVFPLFFVYCLLVLHKNK